MSKVNKNYKELLEERARTLSMIKSSMEKINNLVGHLTKQP
jgi:hypothetical protein